MYECGERGFFPRVEHLLRGNQWFVATHFVSNVASAVRATKEDASQFVTEQTSGSAIRMIIICGDMMPVNIWCASLDIDYSIGDECFSPGKMRF